MTDSANPNPGADSSADWRAPLAALAGDKPEYKSVIEAFKEPSELFQRLTAKPEAPDWRKLMAGDNADRAKLLERYADPGSFLESFQQKDAYINSGKKVSVPGENASAEEIAAWNQARGVPDKPDGYKITAKPPEGLEIDDANKGILTGIVGKLHALGAEPSVVNAAHEIFYGQLAETVKAQEAALEQGPQRATQELAKVWKNETELKHNIAFAKAGIETILGPLDGERAAGLLSLQTNDGYFLADHPEFVKLMAEVGRRNAEDPVFLEASGHGSGSGTLNEQIDAIYALRSSDMKKYNSPETQARLQTLLAARTRHSQGRSAA